MSRTGNLLFPDSEDDGWVTSIIKALPEEKPKGEAPVTDDIEDPVAIEAEAAFAELAAESVDLDFEVRYTGVGGFESFLAARQP